MNQFTTSKTAQISELKGNVQVESASELLLKAPQVGDSIPAGTTLNLTDGSEITLTFKDGSEQTIVAASEETLIDEEQTLSEDLAQIVSQSTPDDVQADINAIQDLIESGDDIELPDTAAGGLVGNEGTDFVTLDRDGNELLAGAGYDTTELDNPTTPVDDPELLARSEQPTITQSDTNTVAEDNPATGNVLNNDSDLDDVLTVQSFTVAGDTTVYLAGQIAIVEGGSLVLNQDGSYTFTPAENYNGVLPVITYTTNTNASDTLAITVTPVSDLSDGDEVVGLAEDTSVTGNILNNAASADGTPEVSDFTVNGTTFAVGDTAELPQGNLTVNQDGSYSFVPAANFNGAVPVVTYTVSDGTNTDISTLSINVTPESDLSDADEVVSLAEDTSVTGNILDNAVSADGTPEVNDFTVNGTTFAVGDTAELPQGNLTVNQDGSYSFVPAENFNGAVPIVTYTVSDGTNTDISTLSINVTPESDLSDADEVVSLAEDTSVTGNILNNAVSADGTPEVNDFTVSGTTYTTGDTAALTEGDLTVNQDGSYIFVPAENFNGAVPIVTYTVSDGTNTDTSMLSINVTPVSDLTDADESVNTAEDTNVTGNVLSNASSADGTPVITGYTIAGSSATYTAGATANLIEGDLTINADGSYTFAPAANYNGPVPVATYTVSDGVNTDTSTLTIAVTPESDLTDADESVSTAEDTNVSGNVLSNASSADGTPVITGFVIAGSTASYAAGDTANLTEGDLTINADGSYTFAPAANYNGPVPVATYTVSDGVNTDTSTLTIAVTPESDLTDADESVSTAEDTNVSGNALSNAASADGTPVIISFVIAGSTATYAAGDTANLSEGDLTINADGSYTFAPAANYNGPVPVATYTVSDGVNTDTSTLTIAVTPESDLTDADESVSTAEDTNVSGNVLSNASSADGTPVITGFVIAGSTASYAAGDTANLTEGDLTINADGSYTFAPAANYNGPVPVATYTVSDGVNTDTSTLTIAVTPESDLTDADESVSTAEDTNVSGNALSNAASADGTPVIISFVIAGSTATYAAGDTANLSEGDLTINADGSYTFAPAANYNGPVPVATYTVSDGVNTDTSTLTIVVTPVNVPPVAANDNFSVNEGQSVSGNVITHNDGDGVVDTDGGDGAVLTITQVNGVDLVFDPVTGEARVDIKDGFILIKADGSFTYSHNGNDPVGVAPSFNYTLSDGTDVDTGNVTIGVTPVNDPPVAANDNFSVNEGQSVSGNVITHNDGDGVVDTDGGDGAVLTITQVNGVDLVFDPVTGEARVDIKDGFILIKADGSFTYSHNGNDTVGVAPSFNYTLSDGTDVDTGNVTIGVTPVNDPPVAANDNFSVNEGQSVSGNVITHNDGDGVVDTDGGDGAVLTITQVNGVDLVFDPVTGEARVDIKDGFILIKADGSFTYSHNGNDPVGVAPSFNYTLSDGTDVDTGNVTIGVTPVNDPPVAANDNFSVNEGQSVSGNVITHNDGDGVVDTDGGDGAVLTITQVNGVDLVFDPVTGEARVDIKDGFILIKADGGFTYTNNGFELGSAAPSFTYTLSDGTDIDTAAVTINVVDYAPDAIDDINFIQLSKAGDPGTANRSGVKGNVILGGSTGDNADTSVDGFGSPTITQVVFDGNTYLFSDTVSSHAINTDFGILTMFSSGSYNFVTPTGMAMPSAEINLKFTYTIQDGDLVNPEVDTADLTINIKPANTTTQSHELDVDLDQVSGTIDTGLAAKSLSHADESAFVYAPFLDGEDFSDILIDGNTEGLERYLVIMGGDEETLVNIDQVEASKDIQVEDAVILEKDQGDLAHTLSATVTNGLLAEGGVILSDTVANPASAPLAELDSSELL